MPQPAEYASQLPQWGDELEDIEAANTQSKVAVMGRSRVDDQLRIVRSFIAVLPAVTDTEDLLHRADVLLQRLQARGLELEVNDVPHTGRQLGNIGRAIDAELHISAIGRLRSRIEEAQIDDEFKARLLRQLDQYEIALRERQTRLLSRTMRIWERRLVEFETQFTQEAVANFGESDGPAILDHVQEVEALLSEMRPYERNADVVPLITRAEEVDNRLQDRAKALILIVLSRSAASRSEINSLLGIMPTLALSEDRVRYLMATAHRYLALIEIEEANNLAAQLRLDAIEAQESVYRVCGAGSQRYASRRDETLDAVRDAASTSIEASRAINEARTAIELIELPELRADLPQLASMSDITVPTESAVPDSYDSCTARALAAGMYSMGQQTIVIGPDYDARRDAALAAVASIWDNIHAFGDELRRIQREIYAMCSDPKMENDSLRAVIAWQISILDPWRQNIESSITEAQGTMWGISPTEFDEIGIPDQSYLERLHIPQLPSRCGTGDGITTIRTYSYSSADENAQQVDNFYDFQDRITIIVALRFQEFLGIMRENEIGITMPSSMLHFQFYMDSAGYVTAVTVEYPEYEFVGPDLAIGEVLDETFEIMANDVAATTIAPPGVSVFGVNLEVIVNENDEVSVIVHGE